MRSTQTKVLAIIETAASEVGLEALDNRQWANTGSIVVTPVDEVEPLLTITYDFQNGYAIFHADDVRHYCRDADLPSFIGAVRDRLSAVAEKRGAV